MRKNNITKPAYIVSALLFLLAALSVSAQDWRKLEEEKRYDEALVALEKLAAKDAARQAEFMRSAMEIVLNRLKKPELARKYIEMTKDEDWRAFFLFYFYNATGQPGEVLKSLQEKGIADFPTTVQTEAYTTIGNIYKARKETDKALEAYRNAVESKGGAILPWSWACKYAADIYMEKGEPDKAVEMYKKCLKNEVFLASRNECLFNYANLLLKEKKTAEALELIESEKKFFDKTGKGYWKAVFYMEYAKILNINGMRVKAIDMYGVAEKSGATETMRKQIEEKRGAITKQMISEL
ncbi:MAG: tetratricopeptide repeat protein [Kiritimatiellia bacterium]